eukprot:COSAG02_NODE_7119_length_3174_cov_2.783740_4_plen_123_part_00
MLCPSLKTPDAEHTDGTVCDFESKICALHVDATFDAFQKEIGGLPNVEGQMPHSASMPPFSSARVRAAEQYKSRIQRWERSTAYQKCDLTVLCFVAVWCCAPVACCDLQQIGELGNWFDSAK